MVDERGGSEYHMWLVREEGMYEVVELYRWVGCLFVKNGGLDGGCMSEEVHGREHATIVKIERNF